ncbi:hypothetical protein ILUMI_21085 [Ignelater luminosus]|uniref:Spindle assembly abnormal protein 6 N-terminal domain-containing protein n=1 Tax=Ignelater luminosus TaxID=2038154 RepID=A0A8K0CJI6_IGNLU|nr:hypothetical protein ILUMI_21085 [Ignelater luminosus]
MSSIDSLSSCSSRFDTRSERSNVIYNNNHCVEVIYNYGENLQRNLLFTIISLDNAMKVKVRDASDYSFNYTALIDWPTFDKMKREQSLDIAFDEFQPQIVELLKQTISKQMLMKVEANDSHCQVIFYEKSRIKALIFLTIDLTLTNQKELVDEMTISIAQLKDINKAISTQLALSRSQLRDTELLLKNALAKNCQVEKTDLELILQTFLTHLSQTEAGISTEISKLVKRHQKLIKDVEAVKNENLSRCDSRARLVQSVQNLKLESERHQRTIGELRAEIEGLNALKAKLDQNCSELRQSVSSKDIEVEDVKKQLTELKRDIQDATMIIAQKTKTNDEIGKDLVQANQMIVNFNSRYDLLTRESDELKEKLNLKEKVVREQALELDRVNKEFEHYRMNFNAEDIKKLEHELFHARQRVEELEKQNKEAVKLNGLLAKKLSNENVLENRNMNRVPPRP